MRRVAIIPARGGSKRLPRKNILDLKGKPMIAWTIEAAINADIFERVVVSTEDQEIADIARSYGAEIDERASELASDQARVVDVCFDFLEREEQQNRTYDLMCCLYATAPLRQAEDIRKTASLVKPGDCDIALAASPYDMPPHQALKVVGDKVEPMWPDLVNKREADVGELIVDNGSTYAVNVEIFKKQKSFYGDNMKVHIMPRERSQDIDEEVDLDLALFFADKILQQEAA